VECVALQGAVDENFQCAAVSNYEKNAQVAQSNSLAINTV